MQTCFKVLERLRIVHEEKKLGSEASVVMDAV